MNPDVQCIECGEYGVSERKAQKGNAESAAKLLRAANIATPIGMVLMLETLLVPKDWPRVPFLIALGILVFAAVCFRDGRRFIPRGPLRTAYTCDACGYGWFPAADGPRRSKPRSGKRSSAGRRGR